MKRKNTYTDQVNKDLKSHYDSAEEFVKFCLPFLQRDEKQYQALLEILPKTPVKDINEFIETVPVMISQVSLREEQTELLIKKLEQIVPQSISEHISEEELIQKITRGLTFEHSMEFSQTVELDLEPEKKRLQQSEQSVKTLSKEEQDIFDYYSLLTLKLWVNFCINKPGQDQLSPELYKSYFPQYLKRINALYEREEIPQSLIEYIENIPLPTEDYPIQTRQTEQKKESPLTINPSVVVEKSEDFYNFFKKNIYEKDHAAFKKVLNKEKISGKILFLGRANQLADTFKRLYTANVISGCSKEELQNWISQHFEYKSRDNKRSPLKEKYLSEVISQEGKPCKNPIIEISKGPEDNITFISPDQTTKNYKK